MDRGLRWADLCARSKVFGGDGEVDVQGDCEIWEEDDEYRRGGIRRMKLMFTDGISAVGSAGSDSRAFGV